MFKSYTIVMLTLVLLATICKIPVDSEVRLNEIVVNETTTLIDISETKETTEYSTCETTESTTACTTEVVSSEPEVTVRTTCTTETEVSHETTEIKPDAIEVYSESDVELLARICMAEAEDQPEYGQRLVIDCILNRVDSNEFPDSVYGVIFQSGQFTPVTNGRWECCYASDELKELAREELENRSNYTILYFCEGGYPSWSTPVCHVGSHYFSK